MRTTIVALIIFGLTSLAHAEDNTPEITLSTGLTSNSSMNCIEANKDLNKLVNDLADIKTITRIELSECTTFSTDIPGQETYVQDAKVYFKVSKVLGQF